MIRLFSSSSFAIGARVSHAQKPSLPSSFRARTIYSPEAGGILVRLGRKRGRWLCSFTIWEQRLLAPLAADLMKDHTVCVPDLRGIGKSSSLKLGMTRRRGQGLRAVVTGLGYEQRTSVVAHDIGIRLGTRTLQCYPTSERLVVLDARFGIEPWE